LQVAKKGVMKKDLQQEFDLFAEDVKHEKCFFCGDNPVFISHMPISEQVAFLPVLPWPSQGH